MFFRKPKPEQQEAEQPVCPTCGNEAMARLIRIETKLHKFMEAMGVDDHGNLIGNTNQTRRH